MALANHPETYYPNTVAQGVIDHYDAHDDGFAAEFWEADIIHDGQEFLASSKVIDSEIALVHVTGVENLQRKGQRIVQQEVALRVRVATHYAGDSVTQQQEAIVLGHRAKARISGHKIPTSYGGVEGGKRLFRPGPLEQELNVANFSVYGFDLLVDLYHNLDGDL
jgi:hypothetical protein